MTDRHTPTFDADGYPTEETLRTIETLDDVAAALDLARLAWHWSDFASEELRPEEAHVVHATPGEGFVRFATGGWSGNESIIAALRQNLGVCLCWQLSARGGLHIYRYPPAAEPSEPPSGAA